jgi:hypothetical protein
MDCSAAEEWPEGYLFVVPHAWRGDGVWSDIQTETQRRIGTTLQEMYADLAQQPLSPNLILLAREIEERMKAPITHG